MNNKQRKIDEYIEDFTSRLTEFEKNGSEYVSRKDAHEMFKLALGVMWTLRDYVLGEVKE